MGTMCCQDDGMQCYEKNEYWAACEIDCAPGVDVRDETHEQTPWTCRKLGKRTPGRAVPTTTLGSAVPTTTPGEAIARTRSKTTPVSLRDILPEGSVRESGRGKISIRKKQEKFMQVPGRFADFAMPHPPRLVVALSAVA